MANNNEQLSDINILKASFCRQHFPDLLQFLRDFDISSSIDENGDEKDFKECLNMHFLTQAYEDEKISQQKFRETDEAFEKRKIEEHITFEKNKRELKENCKWSLDDVAESDVLQAVEDYFKIVSTEHETEELTSILVNNIITESKAYTFFLEDSLEKLYHFEDNTTLLILHNLNIWGSNNESTLGKQRNSFARFIVNSTNINGVNHQDKAFPDIICKQRPEIRFIQAFELLASIRNWTNHNYVSLFSNPNNSYCLYRFIIFTHIGLIYVCRRLWKNTNAVRCLTEKGFKEPSKIKHEETELEINIVANDKSQTISDCEYSLDDGHRWLPIEVGPGNPLSFKLRINKYQKYVLKFKCKNESYLTIVKLNYYAWDPILNIMVKPPKSFSYSFKGIAGEDKETEKYISEIFTKCIETYFNKKASKSEKDKCNEALKKLGEIEPNIKDLQKLLGKVDEDAEQRKKDIHDTIIPQLKGIDETLDEVKSKVFRLFEFDSNNWKGLWFLITIVLCILLGRWINNNFYTLLQSPMILSLVVSGGILFLILAILYIFKSWHPFKPTYWKKTKNKLPAIIITIIIMVLWLGLFGFGIKSYRDIRMKEYDFAMGDVERNQKVVMLTESVLISNPNDNEDLRIKLINYYLDYANDAEKALAIASPMLDDIEKHPSCILAIIEALYSQGKDFWKVRDLLDSYKQIVNRDTNVVNRIEGIMNVWGQGQTSDIDKGISLLRLSSENGDIEAQYYLGYALSHEMTDWEKTKLSGIVETSEFDLINSIKYLRKAAIYKPKAALELGRLYADLNVRDSAEKYLNKAILHSSGELYKESLYRLGLLYEETVEDNKFIKKAAFLDYAPAIIYKANKVADHKSAIELYNSANVYHGYRYILPIAFHYIALGQKNKALKALQEGRPFGKFDQNFILGMEAMLGSPKMVRDSTAGMQYLEASAKQGCLYAEMISIFREAEREGMSDSQELRLTEIGEEIAFAYVLLSYLTHKEKRFMPSGQPLSDFFANQAIGKGHPAGRLMLDVPSYYLDYIQSSISDKSVADYQFKIRQRALRINKNKRLNIIYSYKTEKILTNNQLDAESYNFWDYVSRANNVDLHELNFDPIVFPEITDIELLNEFSDKIIDDQQETPFI